MSQPFNHSRGPQSSRNDAPSTGPITAPYNFVPLAKAVWFPDWADQVSHDVPFENGICGKIDFELTAHTELLVATEKNGTEARGCFKTPDGQYAIPGSALRGMLRNVIEIASFGKMSLIENRWLSVRDLNNPNLYNKRFTVSNDDGSYGSKSQSGWLRFENGSWHVEVVQRWRLEYDVFKKYSGIDWSKALRTNSAREKYKLAADALARKSLPAHRVFFIGEKDLSGHPHSRNKSLRYRIINQLHADDPALQIAPQAVGSFGRFVFTGHCGRKHADFIFAEPENALRTVEVPERVIRAFIEIHSENDDGDWKIHWQAKALAGERIPVFFIQDKNRNITSIGLSQLFRLPYSHTTTMAAKHAHPNHGSASGAYDLAELIFGRIEDDDATLGLRSRISIGLAKLSTTTTPTQPVHVVLNSPKASFYPNYIEQPGANPSGAIQPGQDGYPPFKTLMDNDCMLRGWKRYPTRPKSAIKASPPSKITSHIQPLSAGAKFRGSIRIHNLTPVEYGALLWALTWGGDTRLRHSLGMGKSMGLGTVSIRIVSANVQANNGAEPNQQEALNAFTQAIDRFCKAQLEQDWLKTDQMFELLAMANPDNALATGVSLEHMSLADQDFKNAKGGSRKQGKALRRYSAIAGVKR
ncbi:TIGR03986 family CRISPR-associated RAMP protein [Niveibacterium sp. COAC-50]|uniref:TIGR03986 family type III CRISPR-associated RAMP protein n=1 Tax=Niveibacterium sp. COAC-50 TaxID=2729384 RepID=UPI001557FDFD|nr:TIGR03986 family CRISPR-associated RAMP protein [Niveibacterium sp. COAC-50]